IGDEGRIQLVRLVAAQLTLPLGFDAGWIDHTDAVSGFDQKGRHRLAIVTRRLQAHMQPPCLSTPSQPLVQLAKTCRRIGKVLALARVVLEQAHIQALLTHIYPHIAIHADPPWLTPHRAQPTLYASSLRFCAGLQLPSDFPTACLPHTGLIYQPSSSVSGPGQSHLCVAVCRSLYMGPGMPARALSSRSYLAGQVQPRSIPGNSGVSLMPV